MTKHALLFLPFLPLVALPLLGVAEVPHPSGGRDVPASSATAAEAVLQMNLPSLDVKLRTLIAANRRAAPVAEKKAPAKDITLASSARGQ